ncbi:unnamed protein product [Rotaria sp. Silwood2]|nr:unnamed protein product [Rotaria sp. Silwood2]CAF3331890.1 unnamed protein product [Rotaria sp. Silwood2]CAF4127155.1 unnamed protein product [Rotaria sp. Silwood2]CAF4204285.1 unnamed protein product [Rotaria sp. Silwood2]
MVLQYRTKLLQEFTKDLPPFQISHSYISEIRKIRDEFHVEKAELEQELKELKRKGDEQQKEQELLLKQDEIHRKQQKEQELLLKQDEIHRKQQKEQELLLKQDEIHRKQQEIYRKQQELQNKKIRAQEDATKNAKASGGCSIS